jgi:phospholipid/cholesterol/gamma-HCH transport system permease protein
MTSMPASLVEEEEEPGALVLHAAGEWLVASAGELDRRLHALDLPVGVAVRIDLAAIERLDTAGAWLLLRTEHELSEAGHQVQLHGLPQNFAPLLEQVRSGGIAAPIAHPRRRYHSFGSFLAWIGEASLGLVARLYRILGFVGLVAVAAARLLLRPQRWRVTALATQIEQTGVEALPIVGLLSFLIGVVIAYQGADQLRRFGAEIYTVNLLGVGILRELGALMTAIIIAGRSGSAFTAQIGTMRVNEEIDAMRTIGLDPVEVLVLPRLLGLLLTLPMLTIFADFMGLAGGCLMALAALGITIPQFLHQLQSAVPPLTFWIGVAKAPFFAGIIALVGCYEGFQVARSAESVGRMTTLSVVEAIFFVIVADAAFSVLFSMLRI